MDEVITHHPADTNNDHMQTSMACQEAIRLAQRRPEVKPLGMYRGVMRPYPHPSRGDEEGGRISEYQEQISI